MNKRAIVGQSCYVAKYLHAYVHMLKIDTIQSWGRNVKQRFVVGNLQL